MLKWLKNAFHKSPGTRDGASTAAPPHSTAPDPEAAAAELQRKGNRLLDDGLLQEALQCYEQAASLHLTAARLVNMGFVLKELGQPVPARQKLAEALRLDPEQFDASFLLGSMNAEAGDVAEAALHFERALVLHPGARAALRNAPSVRFLDGDASAARTAVEAKIATQPDAAEFFFFLGNIQVTLGDAAGAVASFNTALHLAPDSSDGHYNLGVALQLQRRYEAAAASFRHALTLRPGDSRSMSGLASVLTEQGLPLEAVEICSQALALDRQDVEAHNTMGNALLALGRHADAVASYQRTIALRADYAEAHSNMGFALTEQGAIEPAIASLRRAVAIKPTYAKGYNNLGNALQKLDRFKEAVQAYHRAISLDADFVQAHNNHAVALQVQGRHEQAIESWRRALELQPDYLDAWSNMLYVMSFSTSLDPAGYLQEACAFGAACAAKARPYRDWPLACEFPPAEGRPLRVGFVSGDFKEHPVGFFLESVAGHMDASRVSMLAYTTNHADDRLTARIKPHFTEWRSLAGLNDETAAAIIRDDGIHILIDLAGHTAHNRLPLFSWRAAPVQLSWLGFFASTGVAEVDFLIADETGVPSAHQANFSEAIRYLPDTRLCFTAPEGGDTLVPGPLPALKNGFITFGCFQNMTKLNDGVLALWGKVFAALPDARLRLQSKQMREPALREELLGKLERHGIAPERVTLTGPTPRAAYLAAHHEVDVMLDTFPYGGGTTTCESLWMGVPTITLAGSSMLARQGASLLSCAGLADWVAEDDDAYVARVVAHCSDLHALAALRGGLRKKALASPLFDARLFADRLQGLLHSLWREGTAQGPAARRSGGPGIDASS